MSGRPPSPLAIRALTVAEKRLGLEQLCKRLDAPEAAIRSWQTGTTDMPDKDFLRLIDLITDIDPEFWTRGAKP